MNSQSHSAQLLANKYRASLAMVERLIDEETERITADALVKTFVPIIAARRVEERLRRRLASAPRNEGQAAKSAA